MGPGAGGSRGDPRQIAVAYPALSRANGRADAGEKSTKPLPTHVDGNLGLQRLAGHPDWMRIFLHYGEHTLISWQKVVFFALETIRNIMQKDQDQTGHYARWGASDFRQHGLRAHHN